MDNQAAHITFWMYVIGASIFALFISVNIILRWWWGRNAKETGKGYHSVIDWESYEEFDACMVWALGEGYGNKLIRNIPEIWNSRHADIFTISGDDSIRKTTLGIRAAWKNRELKDTAYAKDTPPA